MRIFSYQKFLLSISILSVGLLSGCGTGPSNIRGIAGDTRSLFQMVNEEKGDVRDLRNNIQQLIIKLSGLSSISQERLSTLRVVDISAALMVASQRLTSTVGGLDVNAGISTTYTRLPIAVQELWKNYILPPVFTLAVNMQASYLNVAVQYINKVSPSLQPDEIKRVNTEITNIINTLNGLNV